MPEDVIHFLLVLDAAAGRRLRRALADAGGGLGVRIGTPRELLDEARAAYLIPIGDRFWRETASKALNTGLAGFWRESYAEDPTGVTNIIVNFLEELLWASPDAGILTSAALPKRCSRRLADFAKLHEESEFALPDELQSICDISQAPANQAIRHICVYHCNNCARLNRWDRRLIEALNAHSIYSADPRYIDLLETTFVSDQGGSSRGSPQDFARRLFSGEKGTFPSDGALHFLAARDALEEVEISAGMVLNIERSGLPLSKVGLLVPNRPEYVSAIQDVYGEANIPLAGLHREVTRRDQAGDFARQLLMGYQSPVPRMALASMLTSPLMPWDAEVGQGLARRVMKGYGLAGGDDGLSEDEAKALDLLKVASQARGNPISVLEEFCHLAERTANNDDHILRLRSITASLTNIWPERGEPDWDEVRHVTGQQSISSKLPTSFPVDGVVVVHEHEEPWTTVDHLIVLGFCAGHYPRKTGVSPVLFEEEKEAVNRTLGFELETAKTLTAHRRQLLQRQLSAAEKTLTFLIPQRDFLGAAMQPSETSTFIARLLGEESADKILLDPHDPDHHDKIPFLLVGSKNQAMPRKLKPEDLQLGRDLTTLRKDPDGNPKPESPSSLETLLVSPLAWLLRKLEAEPSPWQVDALGILEQGTIAHAVFEIVFPEGKVLPESDDLATLVNKALEQAIDRHLPVANTAQWNVERENLRATILLAARRWQEILADTGAKIIGVETWLQGMFNGIPIHGKTDAVLEMPDGRVIIVDFKKSSSTARHERMEAGFDCQVSLYRQMLGSPGSHSGKGLLANAGDRGPVGVMYFLLNDRMALTDEAAEIDGAIHGVTKVEGDVSGNALSELAEKISGLSGGIIRMNHEDDFETLPRQKKLAIYALEESPIIGLFSRRASEGDPE